MQKYFINNKSDELILIFNGWGMDEKPFLPLVNKSDVLIISDYSSLEENLIKEFDFLKYKKINLIAFSAGVMMANYFSKILPQLNLKISVNGSTQAFNQNIGVSKQIQEEMQALTLDNALEFRKTLISDENQLEKFNQNQPNRTLESSMEELDALKKIEVKNTINFDKIFISTDDKIIPIENQLLHWSANKNIEKVSGGHFPFYNFCSLDEIINF